MAFPWIGIIWVFLIGTALSVFVAQPIPHFPELGSSSVVTLKSYLQECSLNRTTFTWDVKIVGPPALVCFSICLN
jgi:hypothetical protein